jgi:hypothetical protein
MLRIPHCLDSRLTDGGNVFSLRSLSLGTLLRVFRVKVQVMLRSAVSLPVCLSVEPPSGVNDQIFITVIQLRACWCGEPLWRQGGSVVYKCFRPSTANSFSGPSPSGLSNSRHPQLRSPGPRVYIPRKPDGPVIPPGTGYRFLRSLILPP